MAVCRQDKAYQVTPFFLRHAVPSNLIAKDIMDKKDAGMRFLV